MVLDSPQIQDYAAYKSGFRAAVVDFALGIKREDKEIIALAISAAGSWTEPTQFATFTACWTMGYVCSIWSQKHEQPDQAVARLVLATENTKAALRSKGLIL